MSATPLPFPPSGGLNLTQSIEVEQLGPQVFRACVPWSEHKVEGSSEAEVRQEFQQSYMRLLQDSREERDLLSAHMHDVGLGPVRTGD